MKDGSSFKPATKFMEFLSDCIAGGVSAIASKTVIAPIERVKLLLQTQHVNVRLEGKYLGFVDCVKRVYSEQGLISFWRGNIANIVRFFPNHALSFAFKDQIKETFVGTATKKNNVSFKVIADRCSPFVPTFLLCPITIVFTVDIT